MVATVHVMFDFGGTDGTPATQQDTEALGPPNIRFKTADDATIDTVNKIPIVTGLTKYSFWKHIYLEVTTAGGFTQIDNVKFYTDGTGFGTGIVLSVGDEMPTKNSGANTGYEVSDGTVGDTEVELVTGHGGITAKTDAFSYVAATPKSVTISEAGGIINVVNECTNYLVFQMAVSDTATAGDLANETVVFRFDES